MSAIFHALRDNNLSLLKEQLDKGEDVNKQDASDKNMTILHKACIKCNLVAVKLILKYKPVINTKDRSGCSPLLDSCVVGDLDLVGLLLDNGAHINVVDDYRRTPLYWATREDDFELVKLLLSKGADPNIVTLGNWSPLHEARSSEVVKLLVQFGANINYTDAHDDSPLTEASSFGRLSVVQSLCQLGADVNHRGKWGQTALQRATDLNHIPTVKFLLAQQPDLSIVNNSNQTVLQLAREKRNKEIEDLISTYIEKTQIEGGNFSLPLTDQTVEEGDPVEIKCEAKTAVDKVTWLKDSVPPDDHVTITSTGQKHRLVIESVYPTDEGTYTCKLDNGEEFSGKLIVKALFSDSQSKVWSESERRHMVHTCVGKILTAGMFESGKTSVARSLLKGQACLCRLSDRTVIINYTTWQMSDDHTVPIVDVGGHDCYSKVAHFFHCNDESNVVLLIHDIQLVEDSDYDTTFSWMRDIYTHSPRCTILPVLTKCDTISKSAIEVRKKRFANYMEKCIDSELKGLEKYKYSTEVSKKSKKEVKILTKVLKATKKKMQDKSIHVVSCKENTGLDILRNDLVKIFTDKKTSLPQKCYNLYQHVGLLGASVSTNRSQEAAGPIVQEENAIVMENQKSLKTSESNPQKIDLTPKKNEIPSIWEEESSDEEINPENVPHSLNYMLIDDIYNEYYVPANNEVPTEDLCNEFSKYMSFLHSRGLLLWFDNLPQAKKIVFHDLNSFVLLLKTIFNHNMQQNLVFDKLTTTQKRLVKSERSLKYHMKNLVLKGEMSEILLKILLENVGFQEHIEVVTDLLNKLNISTPMGENGSLYVPWFCQNTNQPEELMAKIEKTKSCSPNTFALSTYLHGYVPQSLFCHLCIFVYKFLGNTDRQQIYQWKDNMWTEAGHLNIHLFYKNSQEVCMNTACSPDDQESVKNMWKIIQDLHQESQNLRESVWPGLINETFIVCPHCIIRKEVEPEETLVENLRECPLGGTCECPKEKGIKLPAALFCPLPTDPDVAAKRVEDVVTYLRTETGTLEGESGSDEGTQSHPKQSQSENKDLRITHQLAQLETHMTQQVKKEVQQMLTQQTETLTQQMTDQHRGLAHGIARQGFIAILQSNDASRLPLTCQHPVLLKNQELLQDHLKVDSELLKLLSDHGLTSIDDRKSIENDRTHLGKVKRVLFILEKEPVKVQEFIQVMYECGSEPNASLAVYLGDSYDEFVKSQSER